MIRKAEAKVLIKTMVLNGCLRLEKSDTTKILTPFLEGMTQAGADIEMFYIERMKIQPCKGDFICWNKTPGVCRINDEMQLLYHHIRQAEILVFATPVYIPLPGQMQHVLNRIVALLDPVVTTRKGRTRAKFRQDVNIKKIVLVSSCAWWEKANFETVERIIQELAEDASVKYAGAVLRPHVQWMAEKPEKTEEILCAARHAGFQLIKKGTMSRNDLDTISQPLVSNKRFLETERNTYQL